MANYGPIVEMQTLLLMPIKEFEPDGFLLQTNPVQLSPSWDAASRSSTQELTNILWNP